MGFARAQPILLAQVIRDLLTRPYDQDRPAKERPHLSGKGSDGSLKISRSIPPIAFSAVTPKNMHGRAGTRVQHCQHFDSAPAGAAFFWGGASPGIRFLMLAHMMNVGKRNCYLGVLNDSDNAMDWSALGILAR